MTNKAGARRAQENLYVARQSAASAAFGQRQAALRQQALLAKAREARALASAKAAAKAAPQSAETVQAAKDTSAAIAAPTAPTAISRRSITAPASRVFEAWTHAETLRAFFGAASAALGTGELVSVGIDARVGGSIRLVWLRGAKRVEERGTYVELSSPTRLAFTWDAAAAAMESVAIDIAPRGKGCEVIVAHYGEPRFGGDRSGGAAAWEKALEQLAKAVDTNVGATS